MPDPLNIILKNASGVRLNPKSIATQVEMNDVSGSASNVNAEIVALRTRIDNIESVADAMHFKGVVSSTAALPTANVVLGDTYKVGEAGTYAEQVCEIGDMIICVNATGPVWTVVQNNIDGAVTGPVSATASNLAAFDGTTGKIIKDSAIAMADVSDAVSKKHSHTNTVAEIDAATDFVQSLDSSVTAAALKSAVDDDHTHSNKSTLDAISAEVKTGYDTASTYVGNLTVTASAVNTAVGTTASELDAVIIAKDATIPSNLRANGIVFELEA